MGNVTTYDGNPLKGSICETCRFLIMRTIVPFNEEEYGINRRELGIPDDEEVIYEHYMCEEVAVDLDHLVIKCSKYKPKVGNSLLNYDF